MLLFIGGENIQTYWITGDEKIIDAVNQVKSSTPGKTEKLIKFYISGRRLMVLTNKRFFSRENETIWQVPFFRIGGVETKGGWISGNSRIVLYIAGQEIVQKEFAVEDAGLMEI